MARAPLPATPYASSTASSTPRWSPAMSLFRPIKNLTDAVFMPFKAVFVVGLCALINAMTYSGQWWFKWVALGMGIATLVALARGIKTLLLLALVAWVGTWVYRRYGQQARERFDDWVARTQPHARQVVEVFRNGPTAAR
jgi:hypothetical protein